MSTEYSLLSWNVFAVHKKMPDYNRRIKLIPEEIKKLNPDVFFLQECGKNLYYNLSFLDNYILLSGNIHKSAVYKTGKLHIKNRSRLKKALIFYGNCLISGFKKTFFTENFISYRLNPYKKHLFKKGFFAERAFQITTCLRGKLKFDLINTHLSPYPNNFELRLAQLREIFVQHTSGIIFAGDLNFRPDSLEYKFLTREKNLMDTAIKNSNTDNQNNFAINNFITWSDQNRYFDNKEPPGRLDYIFNDQASGIDLKNFEVIKSELSDHYPIMAKINLPD